MSASVFCFPSLASAHSFSVIPYIDASCLYPLLLAPPCRSAVTRSIDADIFGFCPFFIAVICLSSTFSSFTTLTLAHSCCCTVALPSSLFPSFNGYSSLFIYLLAQSPHGPVFSCCVSLLPLPDRNPAPVHSCYLIAHLFQFSQVSLSLCLGVGVPFHQLSTTLFFFPLVRSCSSPSHLPALRQHDLFLWLQPTCFLARVTFTLPLIRPLFLSFLLYGPLSRPYPHLHPHPHIPTHSSSSTLAASRTSGPLSPPTRSHSVQSSVHIYRHSRRPYPSPPLKPHHLTFIPRPQGFPLSPRTPFSLPHLPRALDPLQSPRDPPPQTFLHPASSTHTRSALLPDSPSCDLGRGDKRKHIIIEHLPFHPYICACRLFFTTLTD